MFMLWNQMGEMDTFNKGIFEFNFFCCKGMFVGVSQEQNRIYLPIFV